MKLPGRPYRPAETTAPARRRGAAASPPAAPLLGAPFLTLLWLTLLCLAVLTAGPAAADDVYLTNGRVFEDVVAEVQGDRVEIRMHHGLIRMPAEKVAQIIKEDSPLQTYLRRKAELEARPGGGAAEDWVDLARWVGDQGLATAFREAATTAARLDPRAEGLEPLMRRMGLLYDEAVDRWVTEGELMRRRGFVAYNGVWVTPEQRAEAERRRAVAVAERIAANQERQRDQALADLASALKTQAETEAAESRTTSAGIPLGQVYYVPGAWVPAPRRGPGRHGPGHGGRGHGQGNSGAGGADDGTTTETAPRRTATPGRRHGGTFRSSDWIPGRLNPQAAPPPGSLISRGSASSRDR